MRNGTARDAVATKPNAHRTRCSLCARHCFGRPRRRPRIGRALLARGPWDLFYLVFGVVHRVGHYLYDLFQIDTARLSESARRTLEGALHAIYEVVGAAVAQLIEQAPADACIIVFAVYGTGPNPGWCELVPEIIARMQHVRGQGGKRRLLRALKRRLPFHWVRPVLKHLPEGLRYALVSAWSRRMFDGRTTRYFPIPMSSPGYLRLNLRGREAEGIVSLGAEYDELCAELETAFRSLRDRETLAPIASAIHGAYRDARDAPRRQFLPDLLIKWTGPHRFAVERLDLRDARRHRCIEPPALRPLRQSRRSRLVHQRRPRDRYGHLGRKSFYPRSRADRLSLARCRALAEVPWQAINAIYP